ncbi:MAG: PilZ domain-containing protein [Candidatus Omnitrophica bacterium]|nr:PilZ domain-containing protein [Candidatus Omnitrophota bacterium]
MGFGSRPNEQRQDQRVDVALPAMISVGSQLSLQGTLRDLSLKSAFITMKSSVYLQMNDEVGFAFQCTPGDDSDILQGKARISRISVGEGLAIYFTEMDDASIDRLRTLLKV